MSAAHRRVVAIFGAVASIIALVALPQAALGDTTDADGPQTWAVVPASAERPDGRPGFDYIVEPDDVYNDFIAVRNFSEHPITVTLYAQDAVQHVGNAFELLTPDEQATRVGAWTRLESAEVTVPARGNVVVPFAIDIPTDAEPGDHAGGIVAVNQVSDGDGPAVQYRVGARIHIRVAGPVEAALAVDNLSGRYETRLSPFASAPLDVDATLVNVGNVRLSPRAVAHVSGLFGWWTAQAPFEGFDQILPDGAQSGAAQIDDVPPIGPLWVTVEAPAVTSVGQDLTELTTVESVTVVVWAVPWVLVAAIVLLLLALVLAILNARRRRRARLAEAAAQVEPVEDADAGPPSADTPREAVPMP